ncbi:MAG: hypothetical protein KKF85_16620 [Gammaproteobacteria bacterium]|nr:hypothetical protein [Rhodocyclaceae bacterium]MBU3910817.1 hypothetical protein [Gammaproteobacteria bacterium]MBU4006271.1 hypothetical protein [Gammaproteobacteria bacterium]MBU4097878.1 hypothetical protein [Gammaproteobacteria bacterium]MBU4148584.1 hypothetical protein [Gammaproteobacteria bacterium]
MEKVLLVMALLGSVYLALRGLVKVGRLLMALLMPKAIPILPSAVRKLDTTGMAVPNDEVEDWSKYEVPAFIRRGIPMPVLEPASAKPTKTRKRRSKAKSNGKAVTDVTPESPAFEFVA